MKKAFAVLAQIILFFLVFAVFSFVPPFGIHWFVTNPSVTVTRFFIADGFLLTTGLFVLVLVIEAITKRLRFVSLTTLGYVIAVVIGFVIKLGFKTHDLTM